MLDWEVEMRSVRHIPFAFCVMLAACGGKLAPDGDTGTVSGSGGSGSIGITPGGKMNPPIISEPDQTDPGVGVGVGGGPTTSFCGNVTCGPGLDCCNPSCGVCTLPNQGCHNVACGVPTVDAGPGVVIGSGPGRDPFPFGRSDYVSHRRHGRHHVCGHLPGQRHLRSQVLPGRLT